MNRNSKLTEESVQIYGRKLYRIQALVDMPQHGVRAGDLGGYVESYNNLLDSAWVGNNALVFGGAQVRGNACVYEYARVFGNAQVYDNAKVYGNTVVSENSRVYEDARVYGHALLCLDASVYGNAEVYGSVYVPGNAKVCVGNISKQDQLSTFQIGKGPNVTITPKHATIVDKTLTHKQWLKITKKRAFRIGIPEDLLNVYKSTLKVIMRRVS